MRELDSSVITEAVARLCVEANLHLPPDVLQAITLARREENSPTGRELLRQLEENAGIAAEYSLPLCQDTGMAVFFVELGQDLHINGQTLNEALEEGVRRGYSEGRLRKSVCSPLGRENSGDNTPAAIHMRMVPGNSLHISFLAKGGGSENMSRLAMLTPSGGWKAAQDFILETVLLAGPNPCPPVIVGVGLGGSFDLAPLLAKKALLRPLDEKNSDEGLARKEKELLSAINSLNIGPMGLGGSTSCLGVRIASSPCHIASLPLAVNIQCHSSRHMEVVL